ncbi:hypothetical protein N2152v2_006495 [Parachlorella kessleri]
MTLQLAVKRAYEHVHESDGRRVLVDRLWPRGLKKGRAQVDTWVKDAAPSTELHKWFGHNPARWGTFQERYVEELHANPQAWQPIFQEARQGKVTLLYGAKDVEHNQAVVLLKFLQQKHQQQLRQEGSSGQQEQQAPLKEHEKGRPATKKRRRVSKDVEE